MTAPGTGDGGESPLSLAEAVPLVTVLIEYLLTTAGVRSLAIKGPAFVALGVREERESNDVDVLIHPEDRAAALAALSAHGWRSVSYWFPPAMDEVIYSTTLRHPAYPSLVDLHHHVSGFFAADRDSFERLWAARTTVDIAHQPIATFSPAHALVLEFLNEAKSAPQDHWSCLAQQAWSRAETAKPLSADDLTDVVTDVGAHHTARELLEAVGRRGDRPSPTPAERRWRESAGRHRGRVRLWELVRRAPLRLPEVAWRQITLDEEMAKYWAQIHNLPYRGRWDVMRHRLRRLASR